MSGQKSLVLLGLLSLITLSFAADNLRNDGSKDKPNQNQSESDKKKPVNILKDYVCLRDGELCHPEFAKNRGLYVSCSNGIAWEQQCAKCSYHPIACPTRSLWFDGEKCEWASPKLASQPCIDKVQLSPYDQANGMTEQQIFQSMESVAPAALDHHLNEKNTNLNRWPGPKPPAPIPIPSSQALSQKPSKTKYAPEVESKKEPQHHSQDPFAELEKAEQVKNAADLQEFPSYLRLDDAPPVDGTKMIKLREPVYTLVDSEDGKPVIMKIAEPFMKMEEPAHNNPLPNPNIISVESLKD